MTTLQEIELAEERPVQRSASVTSDRMPVRWQLLCFFCTWLVYLAWIPRVLLYSSPPTGDQASYLMITTSLAEDHDLNLANNYAAREEDRFYNLAPHPPGFVGMPAPYPAMPHGAPGTVRPQNETYSFHMPGLPLMLVPSWIVGGWFSLWWPGTLVFMSFIGAIVSLNILLLAWEVSRRVPIALAVWAPMAFASPLISYALLVFTEEPAALCVLYAFRRIHLGWRANGPVRLAMIGLCAAYLPWFSWRNIAITGPLALYALYQARSDLGLTLRRPFPTRDIRRALAFAAPFVVSGILLAAYNHFVYGSVLPPPRVPEANDPWHWPWLDASALRFFLTAAFGSLYDRQMGLLTYAPIYLLAAVGISALLTSPDRDRRRLALALLLVPFPYIFLLLSYTFWNGVWAAPARFLTVIAPLAAAALAASLVALSDRWLYRVVYGVLAFVGPVLLIGFIHDPRWFWSAYDAISWLTSGGALHLPTVDVVSHLPPFSPIEDLQLPPDLALVTAVSLLILLVSDALLLERARVAGELSSRATWVHVLKWVPIILICIGAWYIVNAEFVQTRNSFTAVHRWRLPVRFGEPMGLTLIDGRLYIGGWNDKMVGSLDLSTGVYQTLDLHTKDGPVPLYRPSDIEQGPDGKLYVLNNGPGDSAMYRFDEDGLVESRLYLEGKTEIATSMEFAADGSLYVADMMGGRVVKYGSRGGSSTGGWAGVGRPSGFNNIGGVFVDTEANRVYAADLGNARVQEFQTDGTFVRNYEMPCEPRYMAKNGDWIDIGCGDRFMSINRVDHIVRRSIFPNREDKPNGVKGISYGPDGTLYTIQGNDMIVAYHVDR